MKQQERKAANQLTHRDNEQRNNREREANISWRKTGARRKNNARQARAKGRKATTTSNRKGAERERAARNKRNSTCKRGNRRQRPNRNADDAANVCSHAHTTNAAGNLSPPPFLSLRFFSCSCFIVSYMFLFFSLLLQSHTQASGLRRVEGRAERQKEINVCRRRKKERKEGAEGQQSKEDTVGQRMGKG